jgi:hypothetical protein
VYAAIERAASLLVAISTIARYTFWSQISRNSGLNCTTYATCAAVVAHSTCHRHLCWIIATPAVTSFIACACAFIACAFRRLRQWTDIIDHPSSSTHVFFFPQLSLQSNLSLVL